MSRRTGAPNRGAAVTFQQIASRTGIPRSTVHRIYTNALMKIGLEAMEIRRRVSG